MERLDTISSDPNVNSFLQHIRELEAKTSREDEEIARRLEQEIAEGRRRRQAYREARDRSLSPAKDKFRSSLNTFEGSHDKFSGGSLGKNYSSQESPADDVKQLRSIASHLIGDGFQNRLTDSSARSETEKTQREFGLHQNEPRSSTQVPHSSVKSDKSRPPVPRKNPKLREVLGVNAHDGHVEQNSEFGHHREREHSKLNDFNGPPEQHSSYWKSPRSSFIRSDARTSESRNIGGIVEEDAITESIEIRIANPVSRPRVSGGFALQESTDFNPGLAGMERRSPSPSRSPARRSSHRPTSWLESALKRSDSRSPVRPDNQTVAQNRKSLRDDSDIVRSDSRKTLRHSISHDGSFAKFGKPPLLAKPQQLREVGRQPQSSHDDSQQKLFSLSKRLTSFYDAVKASDMGAGPQSLRDYGRSQKEKKQNEVTRPPEVKPKPKIISETLEIKNDHSKALNGEISQPVLRTQKPRPEVPSKPTLNKKPTNETLSSALGQLRPSTSSKYIPRDEVMETLNSAKSKLRPSSPTKHAPQDEGKETLDSAMSHLRSASPTKYVAPDVVKETLTGAMSQLRPSSPQKTIPKDEVKETLVNAMGNLRHSEPTKQQQPSGQSKSNFLTTEDSLRLSSDPITPPVKSRTFGGGPSTSSPVFSVARSDSFPRSSDEPAKRSEKAAALGVHPALEQLLKRGPPAAENVAHTRPVSSTSEPVVSNFSSKADHHEKKLEHLTKGRARGPSRRKPKQKDTIKPRPAARNGSDKSEIILPKLRDDTTYSSKDALPQVSLKPKPLPPRKPSTAVRRSSLGDMVTSEPTTFQRSSCVEEEGIKPKPRKPSFQVKSDYKEKADSSADTIAAASEKTFSNAKKLWEQKSASTTVG